MGEEKINEEKAKPMPKRSFDYRKVQDIDNTRLISIPKDFVDKEDIQKGTEVPTIADSLYIVLPRVMTKKEILKHLEGMKDYVQKHIEDEKETK